MACKTVYVGVNDRKIDLFEGMYHVPNGVAYNSYVIIDEKTAVMDTVDAAFTDEWIKNIKKALGSRQPDYLVVLHMEPDHSASIEAFFNAFPTAKIVGNMRTFIMIGQYFEALTQTKISDRCVTVADGGVLDLGGRKLNFVFTPMVHWPEVMMAYDDCEKALYSADGFGKFGALDADEPWDDEARRYYIGIVGKYGMQVQAALKKAAGLDIQLIRPLHGPVLSGEAMAHALELYDKWSSYTPEVDGVMIAFSSVYGHTREAAHLLKAELDKLGVTNVIYDLARSDMAECVAQAYKYSKLALASTTYNTEVFPVMREFLDNLVERNFQNRTVGIIENGTWAPMAAKVMLSKLEKCKNITYAGEPVKILSAVNSTTREAIAALAERLK